MIRTTFLVYMLALFFGLSSSSVAQLKIVKDLDQISEAVQRAVQEKMPGWKHRRGQPITGSGNVLVESYSSKDATIKLSVIPYDSKEEAEKEIKDLFAKEGAQRRLADLGDEGCAWGYRGSKFAFRRHNLNVFVSIEADDMTDKEKVAKQFAKVVADALKDL